jgi:NAD(P)-dependent dehydrogenase (short-subunit alcohol dehydrogenase family)
MATLNPPIRGWANQRVWVIGASTGIGKSLADALLAKGARVAVSARRQPVLDDAFSAQPRALRVALDLTDRAAVALGLEKIVATWGGIDLVVLMAGTYRALRAWELTDELIRETMETNVYGVMATSALLTHQFLKQGTGHLSIVSSVAGYRGLPKALVYGPSKAAATNFAEVLYIDLSEKGIGVSVVHPGFVRTPLTAGNDFNMPHLIEPEQAASEMIRGYERGDFEIHFPRAFTRQLKLLRMLPYRWYFKLIKRSTGL